jgi:hypothetical protein
LMLTEVGTVPRFVVQQSSPVDEVARRIEDIVRSGHGIGVGAGVAARALPA